MTHDCVVASVAEVDPVELVELYHSVQWSRYAEHPQLLQRAIAGSSYVVTARQRGRLVGLARAVSDGASICYLQDVLVAPDVQRQGIGRTLVESILDRYAGVRQKVLLTDDEPGQRAFYESLGYSEISEAGERTAARIRSVRFRDLNHGSTNRPARHPLAACGWGPSALEGRVACSVQ